MKNDVELFNVNLEREPFLCFFDGEIGEIGRLDYKEGKWFFEGNLDRSAEIFLNYICDRLDMMGVKYG